MKTLNPVNLNGDVCPSVRRVQPDRRGRSDRLARQDHRACPAIPDPDPGLRRDRSAAPALKEDCEVSAPPTATGGTLFGISAVYGSLPPVKACCIKSSAPMWGVSSE